MGNLNNCVFTGRISQVPDLRTTNSGKNVCVFSIAVEKGYGDNKKVFFPTFTAWNGQATFVSKLAVGTMIAISAEYYEQQYTSKSGEKRKKYGFEVKNISAISKKEDATDEQPSFMSDDSNDFEDVNYSDDDLPF